MSNVKILLKCMLLYCAVMFTGYIQNKKTVQNLCRCVDPQYAAYCIQLAAQKVLSRMNWRKLKCALMRCVNLFIKFYGLNVFSRSLNTFVMALYVFCLYFFGYYLVCSWEKQMA